MLIVIVLAGSLGAAPAATQRAAREPAPVLQSSGPLRVARYTKPFAPPPASSAVSYYYDRYCYSAPPVYGCYGGCGYSYGFYYGYWCDGIGGYGGYPTTGVAASGAYSPGW